MRKIIKRSLSPAEDTEIAKTSGMGFSFPYGIPLVVYPLLFWGASDEGWPGILCDAIFLGLAGLFSYEALSKKEYESIRAKDSSMNRTTWVLNWGVLFVALPLMAWLFFAMPRLLG